MASNQDAINQELKAQNETLRTQMEELKRRIANKAIELTREDLAQIIGSKSRPSEIRLSLPEAFDGDVTHAREFITACRSYLRLNEHVYATDAAKVLFILSFMKKGSASEWATYWYEKLRSEETTNAIWYTEFLSEFEKAFITTDAAAEARVRLLQLKQTGTADEYNAQFKMLASRAEIKEYASLEQLYQRGLQHKLLERIYAMNDIPTTMEGWYTVASRLDNQNRRFQMIVAGLRDPVAKYTPIRPKAPERDPDAMEIDRVAQKDVERYKKEGRCFECGGRGHMAKHCATRRNRNQRTGRFEKRNVRATEESEPSPLNATEGEKNIRAIIEQMQDGEKEKLFTELEKKGF